MKFNKITTFVVVQFLFLIFLSAAPEYSKKDVLDNFLEKNSEKNAIGNKLINELSSDTDKADYKSNVLTEPLREMYPDFANALVKAADEPMEGIDLLFKMINGDDLFLAAEASYFLSRLLIGEGRYEEALPHLENIRSKWMNESLRFGEALYYQGVCYSNMLQRTAASDALNEFVEKHTNESPRLLGAAVDIIASLERINRGSIDDVATHMEFSRRKLDIKDAGEETQFAQVKIVEMLDELIKRAEKQENPPPPDPNSSQGQGSSSGQPSSGQGNGQSNAQQGNPNAQTPPRVVRRVRGAAESAWDDLRKRDRGAEALGALKSKYPARYKVLVDQYYRSLQGGTRENE
jgi:tetratricopeptide (TPR) repeat protein